MASRPTNSSSSVRTTSPSQFSPAATDRTAPEHAETSSLTPRVSILTTVPSKPVSAISRFEPPPMISTGSARASRSRTQSMRSGSLETAISRRAGPPTRKVVRSARGTSSCTSEIRRSDSKIDFGTRRSQDFLTAGGCFDDDTDSVRLHSRHSGGEGDLDAMLIVRYDHRIGEPDEVGRHPRRVTYPVGHHPKRRSHGQHAVSDDPGQAYLGGEVVGEVNRVEVARRPRVAHERRTGEPYGQGG